MAKEGIQQAQSPQLSLGHSPRADTEALCKRALMGFPAWPQLASLSPTQKFWMHYMNSREGQVCMGVKRRGPALVSPLLDVNWDLTARNSEKPDANKSSEM